MKRGQGWIREGQSRGRTSVAKAQDGGWAGAGILTAGAGVGFRIEMGLQLGSGPNHPEWAGKDRVRGCPSPEEKRKQFEKELGRKTESKRGMWAERGEVGAPDA